MCGMSIPVLVCTGEQYQFYPLFLRIIILLILLYSYLPYLGSLSYRSIMSVIHFPNMFALVVLIYNACPEYVDLSATQ